MIASIASSSGASCVDARGLAVVLPVKPFGQAKHRLSPVLDDHERACFARAMFIDVLTAACQAVSPRHIFVVTAGDDVAGLAQQLDVQLLREPAASGMTAALKLAAGELGRQGYACMLTMPTDVPLVTPEDVGAVVNCLENAPGVVLVAAADRGGTNAMGSRLLDDMPYCYGDDSFRKHCDSARSLGLPTRLLHLPRVGLDIDLPADIATFMQHPVSTRSRAYLRALGIYSRLHDCSSPPCSPARADHAVAGSGGLLS